MASVAFAAVGGDSGAESLWLCSGVVHITLGRCMWTLSSIVADDLVVARCAEDFGITSLESSAVGRGCRMTCRHPWSGICALALDLQVSGAFLQTGVPIVRLALGRATIVVPIGVCGTQLAALACKGEAGMRGMGSRTDQDTSIEQGGHNSVGCPSRCCDRVRLDPTVCGRTGPAIYEGIGSYVWTPLGRESTKHACVFHCCVGGGWVNVFFLMSAGGGQQKRKTRITSHFQDAGASTGPVFSPIFPGDFDNRAIRRMLLLPHLLVSCVFDIPLNMFDATAAQHILRKFNIVGRNSCCGGGPPPVRVVTPGFLAPGLKFSKLLRSSIVPERRLHSF